MVYDYLVKHNGKYYQPGEEVPENDESVSFDDKISENNVPERPKTSGRRGRPKKTQ